MRNIPLPKSSVVTKQKGVMKYQSFDYASDVLKMLHKWSANGARPQFIAGDQVGLAARTLRVSFYQARTFIRDNPSLFTPEDQKVVESVSFILMEGTATEGVLLRRRQAAFNLSELSMDISTGQQDHAAYQGLMDWISSEREINDRHVIQGPFHLDDYARFKSTAENLRGMYLADITPQKIVFIYHPGGK